MKERNRIFKSDFSIQESVVLNIRPVGSALRNDITLVVPTLEAVRIAAVLSECADFEDVSIGDTRRFVTFSRGVVRSIKPYIEFFFEPEEEEELALMRAYDLVCDKAREYVHEGVSADIPD